MSATEIERIPEIATAAGGYRRELEETWETAPGLLGWLSSVDHKEIGKRYLVTAVTAHPPWVLRDSRI